MKKNHLLVIVLLTAVALLACNKEESAPAPEPSATPTLSPAPQSPAVSKSSAAPAPTVPEVPVEAAQMTKADSLREKPFSDASVSGALAVKQSVAIVTRSGAWYQVSASGKTGWVPMLSVRRTGTAATASAGSLSSLASGRSGTGTLVATTGIRGLNEEELTQATFSEAAVAEAENFRVSAQDASAFASAGKLKKRTVAALPEPGKRVK